jgi:hypothetical protein
MNEPTPRMLTRRGERNIISRRGGIVPFRIVVKSPQHERPCHERYDSSSQSTPRRGRRLSALIGRRRQNHDFASAIRLIIKRIR